MKCNLCGQPQDHEVDVFDCGHAACHDCASKLMAQSSPICPHCEASLTDHTWHARRQAVEMLGEALKFWDNQRGFEVSIGEATLERSVEVYKKREVQFKDRLKKYKEAVVTARDTAAQAQNKSMRLQEDNTELQERCRELNKRARHLEEQLAKARGGGGGGGNTCHLLQAYDGVHAARYDEQQLMLQMQGRRRSGSMSPGAGISPGMASPPGRDLRTAIDAHGRMALMPRCGPGNTPFGRHMRLPSGTTGGHSGHSHSVGSGGVYTPKRQPIGVSLPSSTGRSGMSDSFLNDSPVVPTANQRGLNSGGSRFVSHVHSGGNSRGGGSGGTLGRTQVPGVPAIRSPPGARQPARGVMHYSRTGRY